MAKTRAQLNKAVRQEALREQLAAQGHVQHVVDCIHNIEELARAGIEARNQASEVEDNEERKLLLAAAKLELDDAKIRADILGKAITARMSLVNKYLPDLKAQEIKIEDDREKDQDLQITSTDPIEAANQYTLMMKGSTQH